MITILSGFVSIFLFSFAYFFDFRLLHRVKQADFTSFAAGVGAVYVFIHMIPQLAYGQYLIEQRFTSLKFTGSQYSIYIIALIGFIFFYLFDNFLAYTKSLPTDKYKSPDELAYYWTSVLFICLYNVLIGYVVGSYSQGDLSSRFVYLIAYTLHFVTIKWGIYHVCPRKYYSQARYPIIISLFIGYAMGFFFKVSPLTLAINEALLTGAMILNVFKHELPNEKDSKVKAFTAGIISGGTLFMFL